MIKFDVVIYHGGCPDGITSAWCFYNLNTECEFLPYRYGQLPPNVVGKNVAIVDFSFNRETMEQLIRDAKYLVVLDHHKSAKEALNDLNSENSHIVFDMERSGAQISWDYCYPNQKRPWFVEYVADRDLWKHELPNTKEISEAMHYNNYFNFEKLTNLFNSDNYETDVNFLATNGKLLLEIKKKNCDYYTSQAKMTRFKVTDSEYLVAMACVPRDIRSDVCNQIAQTYDCDFAGSYWYDFQSKEWWISFRATNDNYDLSKITAMLPNGGGHPKAAGFTIYPPQNLETYFENV